MQILLLGAGTVTSRLNLLLAEQGHSVVAQIAAFTPQHIDLFDFRAIIAVSPEASISPESLVKAAERGKLILVVAGAGDGMSSWANGVGVPAIAYPPSEGECCIIQVKVGLKKVNHRFGGFRKIVNQEFKVQKLILGGYWAKKAKQAQKTAEIS